MDEKEYSVSEAVRLIGVESHVLRYWEEELNVEIRRTSQGHRVYSQGNVDLFCQVKKLKEKGIQLKAIRVLLFEKETDSENAEDKLLQKMLDANGMKQTDSEKYHVKTKLATLESDNTESDQDDPEKKDMESDRDDPEKKDMESDLDDPEKKDTESDGKITNEVECGHTYEILTLDKEPDKLRQFERILKRMMEEVVKTGACD